MGATTGCNENGFLATFWPNGPRPKLEKQNLFVRRQARYAYLFLQIYIMKTRELVSAVFPKKTRPFISEFLIIVYGGSFCFVEEQSLK